MQALFSPFVISSSDLDSGALWVALVLLIMLGNVLPLDMFEA